MALTKLTADLDNIQALSDKPNEIEGLTADQLKEKFDKGANDIKDYINDTLIDELDTAYSGLLNFFYPVGTIYETTSTDLDTTTKMANHFGGTWEEYGAGRVLAAKSADTEFDTIGETGGALTHTHTLGAAYALININTSTNNIGFDMKSVTNWNLDGYSSSGTWQSGGGITTSAVGLAGLTDATSSLMPYIVVYRYRRTA